MGTTRERAQAADSRRPAALSLIGLAQLMVVLNATVVTIALPSLQGDLESSDGDRQCTVTAYPLA
ncbi:hypothetical protein [Plantactinospora endophytica]|uniref:MFS transporter n=1 Tax=Plantactinospora endophytica TaxID=673535 RepID=A0ABQ4EEG0_9ACTN|nr:hypothetical protein [Plantactinospora endophytica]GIG93115.1 hypothetical protein Pen02_80510 [Plantactinospora endophytica]